MGPEFEKVMHELALRMRLIRAQQEEDSGYEDVTEREVFILQLLDQRGDMTVSEIAKAEPSISESTISTVITKLWRNKKMVTKTIKPDDQRTTIVGLTKKGKEAIETIKKQRAERFQKLYEAIQVTDDEKQTLIKLFSRAIKYFDKSLGNHKIKAQ